MKILQVIHGYPMRYNAGSEVYTQSLATELANRHEVHIFTRQEDSFLPECTLTEESDLTDPRITLHLVNVVRTRDRYRHAEVDDHFDYLLDRLCPNVIHIQHLNHLSTSLIFKAKARSIPIVFTLHDYWLMCPRGQFIQMFPADPTDVWAVCDGQEHHRCATRCYVRYFSGAPDEDDVDIAYWRDWVRRRMEHIHEICAMVDLFIAPSQYLLARFRDEFGLPANKLMYLNYGFHRARLTGRNRRPGERFTFGYIGTHIPAKGVNLLIQAFSQVNDAQLRIWGRHRSGETDALIQLSQNLQPENSNPVQWMGEYCNQQIVDAVFNHCDAIVVPSIWAENAPLVIHEALQCRVPVITADYGGMAEYVRHEVNGLLFEHRNPGALAVQMQRLVDQPMLAARLGARGYYQSPDGNVPDMAEHVKSIEGLYMHSIARKKEEYGQ